MKKGSKHSKEVISHMRSVKRNNRQNHWNWAGGKNSFIKSLRRLAEYSDWRMVVLSRDNMTCIKCSSREDLHVDHIVSLKTIVNNFLSNYKGFDQEHDKNLLIQLALKWEAFWDPKNGRVLCVDCHRDR